MDEKHRQLPDLFEQRFYDMVKAVDSFFDESIKQVNHFFQQNAIPVKVHESEEKVVIEAFLPDTQRNQIRIDSYGNQVRIRVENRVVEEIQREEDLFYSKKQSMSQRERIVTLPFAVSETSSSASFKNDVLTIVFPKQNSSIKVIDVEDS